MACAVHVPGDPSCGPYCGSRIVDAVPEQSDELPNGGLPLAYDAPDEFSDDEHEANREWAALAAAIADGRVKTGEPVDLTSPALRARLGLSERRTVRRPDVGPSSTAEMDEAADAMRARVARERDPGGEG